MPYRHSHAGSRHYASMSIAVLWLLACISGRPLLAQGVTQPLWTRDSLRSSILGEQRFVRISLPAFYNAPWNAPVRFPVLIVLDAQGDLPFTAIAASVRAMAEYPNTPAMPPLIIVGVETPNPSRRHWGWSSLRIARDLQLPLPTVVHVQRRPGLARIRRPAPPPVQLYERAEPGELVHLDIKLI